MNHIAFFAVENGKVDDYCDYVRKVSGNSHFEVEEADNGYVSTSALQGPPCKKLLGIGYTRDDDAIANLIDSAGIVDGGFEVVDDGEEARLDTKCRTRLEDGTRCPNRQKQGKAIQCAGCIRKQTTTKVALPRTKEGENPIKRRLSSTQRTDFIKLGETMRYIFPALNQVEPFYDTQYECIVMNEVDEMELDEELDEDEIVVVAGTYLGAAAEQLPTRLPLQPSVSTELSPTFYTTHILNTHTNKKLRGKRVRVVRMRATAQEQLDTLQAQCNEFGQLWLDTIGDERVSAYVHLIACHATPLMEKHKSLGKFSNSVIESFHKLVRFYYQRTAREGGVECKESCYAIMQKMIGTTLLEIEEREGGRELVDAVMAAGMGNRADCNCAHGGDAPCSWKAAAEKGNGLKQEMLDNMLEGLE